MQKLLIIDGNAILHRAYHAYPPVFNDKDGNPTNAIYGFYAMLIKMFEEVKPDYLAICFDRGEPTFRMNLYAGYHANRPKMADDLFSQVDKLQESLENIGIPLFGVDGYEADDLIGTLSVQAKKEGVETVIVTGDRDLLQLVNDKVTVLMPLVGITKYALMTEKAVEEKYGIKPSQIIDYKALVGDASDNYPGVAGIGPKTASGLLNQYNTFENLYKHIGDLPQKISERLATDAEQASMCKTLATIHTDAPIHLKLKDSDVKQFTEGKFLKEFYTFNINSLKKRLGFTAKPEVVEKADKISDKKDQLELI
jgi:DNA polymerase-1